MSEQINRRIDDLVANKPSGWLKEAEWRMKNRAWLDHSFEISLQILLNLRNRDKNYKWLSEQLNISEEEGKKIVKGKKDFTLSEIAKIEEILNITLIKTRL